MHIYVDATTLIALGQVGELDLLTVFDSSVIVPAGVIGGVSTEPAESQVKSRVRQSDDFIGVGIHGEYVDRARSILNETGDRGDIWTIAAVLSYSESDEPVAVVSNDRRVRTVARGLGATVTGIGVVVRNVAERELATNEAKISSAVSTATAST
ncbi:hypothetical protein [Salinigranum marinum]|uniref:hypothetical protein n=1 Tax=Salinigranum marinum TaxID=1515595 RepID=UPI002989EE1C|nr:hypothetical protein [Salinigranum marinum]